MTPHGFGHATRTCAVVAAIRRRRETELLLLTDTPPWVFENSLGPTFDILPAACDVGLVQRDPLHEDVGATADRLDGFLAGASARIEEWSQVLADWRCDAVLCDASALGIAVADRLGVPAVLVENFVWSWVYRSYVDVEPRMAPAVACFREWEDLASLRVRCHPSAGPGPADPVAPVYRESRLGRRATRRALGVSDHERLVLWTMGGVEGAFPRLDPGTVPPDTVLVVPGAAESEVREGALRLLPRRSDWYHPDLVAAADGVVAKVGYSTLAEAWSAGARVAYLARERFPESPPLAEFARVELGGFEVKPDDLHPDSIGEVLERLVGERRLRGAARGPGGAATVAGRILGLTG